MVPVLLDYFASIASDGQDFDFALARGIKDILPTFRRHPTKLRDPNPILLAHIDREKQLGAVFAAVV